MIRSRALAIISSRVIGLAAVPRTASTRSLKIVVHTLHRLTPDEYGRFPAAELERFAKEDYDLIHGKRLIQRNDRLIERKRAAARQAAASSTSPSMAYPQRCPSKEYSGNMHR